MEAFRLDCDHIDFTPRSLELSPVNFFYGKNGTGKSTLVELLKRQYEGLYTVQIFRGHDSYVSENRELNAITLGQTNVEVQQKIDQLNTEISQLEKELDLNSEADNCGTRLQRTETHFADTKNELDKLYSKCASAIKNITNPSVTPTAAYNKNNFRDDIEFAKELPQSEIDRLEKECLTDKLPNPKQINYPIIDFTSITQKVNDILTITPTIQLPEIGNNPEKQAFAKEGMRVHNRDTDNKCAFCGGPLTPERWDELSELFNDAASAFQKEIKTTKQNVNSHKAALEQVELLNPQEYYPAFHNSIMELNQHITNSKDSAIQYLNKLSQLLSQREKQLFTKLDAIACGQPSWKADKLQQTFFPNFYKGDNSFKDANKQVFVLLTHNAHFFLNARPYRWQPGDKKVSCFTLTKENSTTAIQKITAPTDDIRTGYEALWHELHFAYNNDRPMSMLNILRRIIDSFADFNCTDSLDVLTTKNVFAGIDCRIAAALKKSADVYSHGIYEPDSSADNFTREQIIKFARWYFDEVGGIKHFQRLWNISDTNPVTD